MGQDGIPIFIGIPTEVVTSMEMMTIGMIVSDFFLSSDCLTR
jgi:hypothetical protein